jgi:hypothetical protein
VQIALEAFLVVGVACGSATSPPGSQPANTDTAMSSSASLDPSPTLSPLPAWPRGRGRELHFETMQSALAFLRRGMDIPIRLPSPTPSGLDMDGAVLVYAHTVGGERAAQLSLTFGRRRHLIIQYGVSTLDGCAPEVSVPVQVGGQPGRLRMSDGPWAELIWPATLAHPVGVYGLAGYFSKRAVLAMGESMSPAPAHAFFDAGC